MDELAAIKKKWLRHYLETGKAPNGGRHIETRTFIETGTAGGGTVDAALDVGYDRVVTIELNHGFYRMASQRFLHNPHVTCLYGDSKILFDDVMTVQPGAAVILLDAHYTGGADDVRGETDTPVGDELNVIIHHPYRHIVMIDDARLFGTDPAYPTLETVEQRVTPAGYVMRVEDDIIHLTPGDN